LVVLERHISDHKLGTPASYIKIYRKYVESINQIIEKISF
jgi:hypothetical protein